MDQQVRITSRKRKSATISSVEVRRVIRKAIAGCADPSLTRLTAPQLAQSPTSLLSLPNDNLLLIFEKVYEDRYNLITADTPLRIAEILINKRIFSLARPLWFKHLSVSESHLDLRLAGIFDDKARRGHLRSLDVDVDNSHYNLVKSALLRLPDLTDLALKLPRDFSPHAFTVLVDAVSSLPALKRLRLRSDKRTKKLADFWKAYLGANPCTEVNVSYSFQGMVLQKEYSGTTTGRLLMVKSFTLTPTTLGFLSPSSWPTFLSLTLWARGGLLAWNDEVLEGLETAIQNEVCPLCSALLFGPRFTTLSLAQAIYLERLKLQITFLPSRNPETYRCFAPRDYEQLLQLLQRTNLQQLHLASLQRIPDTPSTVVIGSVRLLRLSGSCSFKDSVKDAFLC